uniref:Pentraxin (PTX) domain-containing protein n=1 Tax=Prolemur simus TaxID=1328070 RepID=A0A8C9A7Z8_PROSS
MEKLLWCFLVLISFSDVFGQTDMDKKAFVFPTESDNSFVSLKAQLKKPLKAFTVCLHVYIELSKTRGYSIFSYRLQATSKVGLWPDGNEFGVPVEEVSRMLNL